MQPGAVRFLQNWLVNTFAVLIAVIVVPGIHYEKAYQLLLASLLLGVLNAFVRPFLMLVALPFLVLTLGLFMIVINGVLLSFTGLVVPGFRVDGFGAALLGALILGVVALVLNALTGFRHTRVRLSHRREPPSRGGGGGGSVIDV